MSGIYLDATDTLFIVDEYNNDIVWKLPKNTVNTTLVAGLVLSFGGNASQFSFPQDVYVDSQKNVFVTDYYNIRMQKFVPGSRLGVTIAGVSGSNGSALNQFGGLRYFWFD